MKEKPIIYVDFNEMVEPDNIKNINNLSKQLKPIIEKGNCFTSEVRDILIDFKNCGGLQKQAQQVVEKLKAEFGDNETFYNGADDVLDFIAGCCSVELLVWDELKDLREKS